MAVTLWENLNDGRGGKEVYQQDGTTVTTRTKQWRVHTSAQTDDDTTVMSDASAPKIGASHANHASCRCVSRSCDIESHEQKFQFIFSAEYSTKWDIRENPLDDPAKTEWSTETFQTIVYQDTTGGNICNSAGDPFDPPAEKDDSRWTTVTRKNVATTVPDWIFAYQDGVNSDAYSIDGVQITAGWAKVSAIHLSEVQERNEIEYRVLTVTIHYRGENESVGSGSGADVYGSGSGGDEVEPWHLNILDAGFRELTADSGSASGGNTNLVNIKDSEGGEVTAPVPLDGEGYALDDPTPTNSIFLQFQLYHEKAFALITAMFS